MDVKMFRNLLLSLRNTLQEAQETGDAAEEPVELDQTRVGRLSRMDALQAQQMAQETTRRRQVQLQRIDSALHRMDAGDYGYCFLCGDEISSARLDFDPASTRCIGCMDK